MSRRRIFEIIEKSDGDDRLSSIYDASMDNGHGLYNRLFFTMD